MASSTFTYTNAAGQRVVAAFKVRFAEQYAIDIAADPTMTDAAFWKKQVIRLSVQITREVEGSAAGDAARVTAEAEVAAATIAAQANVDANVTIT
jgi:hypothetical protein